MSRSDVTRRWRLTAIAWAAALLLLVGCQTATSSPSESESPEETSMFTLTSSAFGEGAAIPVRFTCDGEDVSPPIAWSGAPDGTAAFALILDDPDARGWVHWVFVDLPGDVSHLEEGASGGMLDGTVPVVQGLTSFGQAEYGGPCPPGGTHRYVFTLFALDEILEVDLGPLNADSLRTAMGGHVLDEAVLTGTYAR